MVCDNENKNGPKAKNITISYLRRMIFYADALANGNDATTAYSNIDSHAIKVEEDGSEGTGEELVSILARKLLLAADPSNLISSLTVPFAFFPKNGDNIKNEKDQDDTDEDDDDDDVDNDEEENNYPPYYKLNSRRFKGGKARDPTRIDALRSLLRALAPIALDIATRASCHVLMSNRLGMNGDHIKREKNIDDTNGNAGASKASSSERERLQVFILFGFWVPLAPQLSPIISDLFGEFGRFGGVSERSTDDESSACPLGLLPFVAKKVKGSRKGNHIKSNNCEMMQEDECERIEAEEAVVASEAARELLEFYCFKRYENDFARKWWDWDTPLFLLIHTAGPPSTNICNIIDGSDDDGDAIMDGNAEKSNIDTKVENLAKDLSYYIGGHSPETNAPHCIEWKNPSFQMKWHASRAVGALFSLRPLPLSNFLKKLSVYESDVPFMRHPWSIYEEEAVWESNLMHGVGKIVLPKADQVKIKYGHHVNELLPAVTFQEDGLTIKSEESKKTSIDGNGNDECTFQVPSIEDIRKKVPVHPSSIHVGKGILVPRRGSVASYDHWCRSSLAQKESQSEASNSGYSFIPTDTTMRNMSLLGVAMSSDPHPPPVLVCGPPGSGKSSLVRELARLCSSFASSMESSTDTATYSNNRSRQLDELLELHVDEETDSKTLLGSYVATDIPGEFIWMAGPLTSAARLGRWVLIEDVDRCPEEIQAALLRLLEERILPLGVGKDERCHPGFRLFGTCVTMGVGGKRVLHPNLWRKVHVDPLPFTELREVGRRLYPGLPHSVSDAALDVLRKLDRSGRGESFKKGKTAPHSDDMGTKENYTDQQSENNAEREILGHGARHASVREYTKLLSRISSALDFEPGSEYATESQRLICLVETVDVFAMACPCFQRRRSFICQVAAPIWALTADAATRYVEDRIPVVSFAHNNRHVEVGRARLMTLKKEEDEMDDVFTPGKRRNFAETSHALRFMESIAVCASENEPALLVGETGCGKTTLVQRLASLTGRSLLVQNLSLQTDSTDLLGGYKPLEMRHVARGVYDKFVDLFVSSFSRSQNAKFLKYVLTAYEKKDWKKLAQCFLKAASMGDNKMRELCKKGKETKHLDSWADFRLVAERFERQRVASESGLAFLFTEGALVDAIRTGKWVLLDEINLASSETLERLCGLLDDSHGSITLTEKGDAEAVCRHPDFRLFAAMNPATDAGKKDLPSSIRSRFTEIYVDELVDPLQLRSVAARYLDGAVTTNGVPLEHSESVMASVDLYLKSRSLSEQVLVDGGGQKPRYTTRTLCRALIAGRNLILQQRFAPQRAILEGFELAFEGPLDLPSRIVIQKHFNTALSKGISFKERDHPGRRPDGKKGSDNYILIKPFWIKTGNDDPIDWSEPSSTSNGRPKFVLTPSATSNLRRLCQAVASGPWSILLEGPTSAGKTTLVEYLAARCGHRCVRINNHEHTDIQEYTGSYAADSEGKISFQEGILVQALRNGHWVILDELNLAPSEVLEALNRLLDDNRELYLPEINETVKPHPNFRLFATQNPAGAYGGRKPLSRAFRNRFVEIHMADIPEDEMIVILERRCGCAPSHAKLLVKVMKSLRQRRSRTGIFRGKDGLVTPRDLLRWANRGATSKIELAREGYMLLAERLRIDEEKDVVKNVIEKELRVSIDLDETYYGDNSEGRTLLKDALEQESLLSASGLDMNSIAPTGSILRLLSLVMRCIKQQEPVLLVGDTGCGKTTVVQLLSIILQRQLVVVNCHASTETSDLLGGFRPVRGRPIIVQDMVEKARSLIQNWLDISFNINDIVPSFIIHSAQLDSNSNNAHEHAVIVSDSQSIPHDAPKQILDFSRALKERHHQNNKSISDSSSSHDVMSTKKKRKLSNGKADSASTISEPDLAQSELLDRTFQEIEILFQKFSSLFEWVDGPLVCSMKDGNMLLLDEMSLAEDAVLERLNSVLEPSRTLVLAEKGGEGPSCVHESEGVTQVLSSEIRAHENFRIFATMNPGGDFGKRELSPALRSRFTEIWVPAVSDRADIDLVLERSLSSCVEREMIRNDTILKGIADIRKMMLDYVDWFNVTICDDPNSFCNDFKLSLRDVLSWARFIADVYLKAKSVDQWSAYAHGASLMHLDGLGLGTGVSSQDALVTRNKAKNYLNGQITSAGAANVIGFQNELEGTKGSLVATTGCFGVNPFIISTGNEQIPEKLGFNMLAPTTGMNLRRVLRALQISKPVLLEGSPGVGKTSLIAALAKASGHNLVRINLSEQTDISDLMGSDVPYSGDTESDSSPGASFRWCDGVFLKAIKQGDWVLLDELNLASQSVLEGLNSCLDHRASVYIPELGQTFACPPSFRIFAAQNPLAQGGGRKGLPKSFLNRFTKVYIEALTNEDLFNIVTDQFPTVPTSIVEKMISFNDRVQHDIDSRLYGQHGSPWEFNLRDVFRWCQLLTRSGLEMSLKSAAKYADILYTQRLRIPHDRMMIRKRVHDHFGDFFTLNSHPKLEVTSTGVLIGDTLLDRFTDTAHWSDVPLQDTEPDIAQSLLSPMEAVACCVRMDWSCLLVGPASSGKSALLKTLADACNVHIETLAMTSSTDVTELIGCFEQTDSMGNSKEILKSMKRMYDGACLACKIDTEMLQTLNTHYWVMNKEIMHIEGSKSSLDTSRALLTAIEKLIECFVIVGQQFPAFSTSFSRQIIPCQQWLSSHRKKSSSTKGKSPFQWVDGILVQAMEKGYWLHLENVNFCPSSVLDRLNPLMEFGGELVMTECGISDDTQNAKSRVIKPHHNFRLFLSMNPNSHGEVSRAMRNRCIEVCLLPPSFGTASPADAMPLIEGADVETIDALACLWGSDVRTHVTGQSMFSAHKLDFQRCVELHDDPPTIKTIKDWGTLFSGLLKRGMAMLSLPVSHRLLYEIHENDHCQHNFMTLSSSPSLSGLIKGISTRRDLEFDPAATRILKESRLLRMMTGDDKHEHASEALNYFDSKRQPLNEHHKHETRAHLRFQSICRLAETVPLCDFQYLASSMDGFCLTSASQIKVMVTILNDVFLKTGCGEFNSSETLSTIFNSSLGPSNDSAGTSDCSPVQGTDRIATLHAARIPHLLEEAVTYYQLYHTNAIPTHCEMNVIAMSYYVNKKQTEAPFVGCPVTPQIFPLFRIVDDFFGAWQNESHCLSASKKQVMALEFALLCRDRLWQCLKRSQYLGARSNSLIGFDFTGFFTQYCWFKKSLSKFILLVQDETKSGTILASLLRRLHLSLETIDEAIQESMGGSISSSDILWKRGGHPLLPSSIVNFEELNKLKVISNSCALVKEESFGFTRLVSSQGAISIDLRNLIATNHPILFVQKQFHTELLGALAMTFWAATDEMREISAKDYNISSAPKVLQCSFQHAKEDFVADINFATIDTSIKTVDNALDLDTIKSMTGENSVGKKNSDDFIQHLILRFGEIQASQIGEIWCISDEAAIIGMLSHVLCQYQDPKQFGLIKDLRRHCHDSIVSFIAKASSHTQWPIEDLRPYQTLLWALESKLTTDDSIKRIISCVLPRMFHSFFNHQWCNSYNDLDSISCNLLGPSLWNKEDQESQKEFGSSSLDSSAKSILLPNCAGPCRTELNVHRTAIFRLLRLPADGANGPFFTMENGDARKAQARKLLSLFARYAPRDDKLPPTVVIKYLLGNVFSVFQDVFQGENIDITKLLNSPPSNSSDVAVVLKSCQHNAFQTHFSKLMIPLVETLQLLNVTKEGSLLWKRSVSRAWIYVGLLRLHLVIPSSPIDPGRKPAAKVEQLNWFLGNLSSNLRSYSLHFGLSSGEFNPDSSMTKKLVAQGEIASRKRISQEKKIIERPSNASPFLDLFREIHHFCKTVATVDNVLALADLIENPCPETSFRSQEVNWQCSATAFCNRLSTFYSMYEDVTIPCMNEIRILQRGLRELALSNVESSQFYPVVQTQDKLLEYPFRNNVFSPNITEESLSNVLRDMLLQFGVNKGNGAKHDTAMIHQSYLLATLVRLQLYLKMHNLTNVNSSILGDLNVMFSSLANSSRFDTEEDKRTQSEGHTTVDESEQNEKVLREYFPDHGAEFERIIRAVDDDDEDTDMGVNEEEEVGARTQISQLSDFELSLVVSLHEDLFSGSQRKLDDNLRVRAFITSYEAASRLGQLTEWMRTTHDDSASMGAHMMALALRCNVHRRLWSPTLSGDSVSDFHNDPSPAESVKADIPLRALLIRVGQLLRAFPGHSILVALGQVVERVRQLDIQVVPLGKIMSGLEVILRKAQDWEQHASQYVLLGKPLQDIGSLVASLRKLELQSWSCLLTTRERRRSMRATRHWPNLYRLIHNTSSLEESKTTNSKLYARSTSSPSWVWKGFPKISERLAVDGDTKSIDDLVKVFDTFILTSDLSQFWSRLGLIKSFVNELRNECEVLGLKRFPLTRMLHSFWNYYSRFTPLLTRKKDSLREPIEKRLKDEVKLAKWDEQSYYALADSNEKNHSKLMKFLRDYDEALDTSVMSILEQNFAEGVRSCNQTKSDDQEPVTSIPGNSTLFPEISQADSDDKNTPILTKKWLIPVSQKPGCAEISLNDWESVGLADAADKYLLGISHYARRMVSIIPRGNSWAQSGATFAADISDAVFSRISILRDTKPTKQVKQRALVDLFKCLKEQGYSSMKWSVPSSVRDPHQMLQLPVPSTEHISSGGQSISTTLEKGESYFHRCQVEISRLRFEVSMLGSQYMSQREMTLMQGYSEYVLFMLCQQRSMLAIMLQSVGDIESFLQSYDDISDSMPSEQTKLSTDVVSFENSLFSLIESLHELVLLIKESSSLVTNEKDRETVRDSVAVLMGCVSKLEQKYVPCAGKMPITSDRIDLVSSVMSQVLIEVTDDLLSCAKSCDRIFPSTIFGSCLEHLNDACALSASIKEDTSRSDSTDVLNHDIRDTMQLTSSLIQSTLISAQSICTKAENEKESSSIAPSSICTSHSKMIEEWDNLQLEKLKWDLNKLSNALVRLHNDGLTNKSVCSLCTMTITNSFTLVRQILHTSKSRMVDALSFYHQHSKMLYILLRVFRNLIAKGFCSDDVADGGEGDGEGGAGEMKFEDDVEGTGMGEGDGKEDVTDQIENEEQLLGLKGDEQETSQSQERKELDKEEVDTGMEMEADFEGEKYDLPEQQDENKNDNESENEEELDREMGDGNDPNEQVVDEKMWDKDEDDLEDLNQEEEKFEDDSKMAGEQLQDEMRTKDQSEDDDGQAKEGSDEHNANQKDEEKTEDPQESAENDDNQEVDNINDDTEDKYEDKHDGVEVRNDENAAEEKEEDELGIDLDDTLNLDDGEDQDADSNNPEDETGDGENVESNVDSDGDGDGDGGDHLDVDEENDANDNEEMCDPVETVGQGGDGADDNNDTNQDEDEGDDDDDSGPKFEPPSKSHHDSNEETLGVAAEDGQDAVNENKEQNPEDETNEGGQDDNVGGADENIGESFQGNGGSGNDGDYQKGKDEEQGTSSQNEASDVPNPFRSPGDAEKFWHKKLDIIQDNNGDEDESPDELGQGNQEENDDNDGKFEYTKEGEDNSGQVLGVADEDQAKQLEDNNNDDFEANEGGNDDDAMDIDKENAKENPEKSRSSRSSKTKENPEQEDTVNDSDTQEKQLIDSSTSKEEEEDEDEASLEKKGEGDDFAATNRASTDRMQMQDDGLGESEDDLNDADIIEIDAATGLSADDVYNARQYWQTIQSETNNLSRRLCEKLRLVMEPLVATKLRGDYRTGKRVNMKRIIGYIASGYRKDKIWLRRTKPAKRDYRILIAVDDSESMQKSQAGDMALKALATLANGMSQLEIGQLGIASFGEEMRLLHPFHIPFTSESGVNVVSNFKFDEKRTRTALCVESAISALEGADGVSSSMQLVFMISDGRIERDSRSKLRRLIREMAEKNMLMVMIIVEGEESGSSKKSNESILNMKEVSFVNGKPNIKHFIEDYPFPYYLVVGDLAALPEILGDALRQWFEMLAQIQSGV